MGIYSEKLLSQLTCNITQNTTKLEQLKLSINLKNIKDQVNQIEPAKLISPITELFSTNALTDNTSSNNSNSNGFE